MPTRPPAGPSAELRKLRAQIERRHGRALKSADEWRKAAARSLTLRRLVYGHIWDWAKSVATWNRNHHNDLAAELRKQGLKLDDWLRDKFAPLRDVLPRLDMYDLLAAVGGGLERAAFMSSGDPKPFADRMRLEEAEARRAKRLAQAPPVDPEPDEGQDDFDVALCADIEALRRYARSLEQRYAALERNNERLCRQVADLSAAGVC